MTETAASAHISLNGAILPREQANISVFNQALFYSFGVYESIEIDAGISFHLDDHLDRLFQSAEIIELPMRYGRDAVRQWIEQLIEKDRIYEALLRILVLGPNGDESHDDTLVYILPGPLPAYPSTLYTAGATAITYEGSRPLPRAKTLNTLVNYLALRHARRAGAHEAFLVGPDACLTEGSRSNLFVVAGQTLITPPAEQVLSGITRDLVWRLAESRHIPIVEQPVPRAELAGFDEMFVTSTSMHVIPIVRVDEQRIGTGAIGPLTHTLMQAFEAYYAHVMGRQIVSRPA